MKNHIILLIATTVFLGACSKKPVACIDPMDAYTDRYGVEYHGVVGQSFEFGFSCSEHAPVLERNWGESEFWDKVENHYYTTAGTYVVKVRAMTKEREKISEARLAVTIKENLGVLFTGSYNGNKLSNGVSSSLQMVATQLNASQDQWVLDIGFPLLVSVDREYYINAARQSNGMGAYLAGTGELMNKEGTLGNLTLSFYPDFGSSIVDSTWTIAFSK